MSSRTQVLSYGGGVQSAAIAVLIARGDLPRPDLVVMADTGREATPTWDYLRTHINPMLIETQGLSVQIAPHDLAKVDLYSGNGDLLMPMYTKTQGGQLGKMPGFCSTEWKQRVVMRWLRNRHVRQCDIWIGFSLDEINRVKPMREKWIRRVYPLLGFMESNAFNDYPVLSRADCKRILTESGIPSPMKSACWMCPHRTNAEWRELKRESPEEFQAAVNLEKELRDRDSGVYLHQDAIPLNMVDITIDKSSEDEQCSLGFCFT